jgi:hypothetical protein
VLRVPFDRNRVDAGRFRTIISGVEDDGAAAGAMASWRVSTSHNVDPPDGARGELDA